MRNVAQELGRKGLIKAGGRGLNPAQMTFEDAALMIAASIMWSTNRFLNLVDLKDSILAFEGQKLLSELRLAAANGEGFSYTLTGRRTTTRISLPIDALTRLKLRIGPHPVAALPDADLLSDVKLSPRTRSIFYGKCRTVGEVRRFSRVDLLRMNHFGPRSLAELREKGVMVVQ